MYTRNTATDVITRNSDGAVVSPLGDATDPGFLEFNAWANAGNFPTQYTPPDYPLIILDPAQFKKALLHKSMKATVETALQQPGYEDLQIDYEYKTSFHSNDPRIVGMALALGLTEEWLYENIFVYGQTLS